MLGYEKGVLSEGRVHVHGPEITVLPLAVHRPGPRVDFLPLAVHNPGLKVDFSQLRFT